MQLSFIATFAVLASFAAAYDPRAIPMEKRAKLDPRVPQGPGTLLIFDVIYLDVC